MIINKVHCFFEQSGTFKNEFKRLGIHAEDYDIQNEFGETDNVVDLFTEIDKAYDGEPSLFDNIGECDLVFAFFPCTRFQEKNATLMGGCNYQMREWADEQKLEYSMKLHEELHQMYMRICKLFSVCLRGGYRLIVENPYTHPHYLTLYFPIKPALVDKDRTNNGDYYRKPTQFWFVNCKPESNLVFEPLDYVQPLVVNKVNKRTNGLNRQTMRSMIHPQYARRFIKQFVIEGNEVQR